MSAPVWGLFLEMYCYRLAMFTYGSCYIKAQIEKNLTASCSEEMLSPLLLFSLSFPSLRLETGVAWLDVVVISTTTGFYIFIT